MFRKLIAFLSTRFPEQRIVSLADYEALKVGLILVDRKLADMNINLVALDAQIKRLNDREGFVSTKKGSFALER